MHGLKRTLMTKRKSRGQETRRNQHAREERYTVAASGHRDPRLEFSRKGAIKNENTKNTKKYTHTETHIQIYTLLTLGTGAMTPKPDDEPASPAFSSLFPSSSSEPSPAR